MEVDCCPSLLLMPPDGSGAGSGPGSGEPGSDGPAGPLRSWADDAGMPADRVIFQGWKVKVGDPVKKGDVIATVIKEGPGHSGPSGGNPKSQDSSGDYDDDDEGNKGGTGSGGAA